LLTADYAAALRHTGAVHCYTVHPTMPRLPEQAGIVDPAEQRAIVVRWMLGGGLGYDEARERYQPFDRIVDADDATADDVATLLGTAVIRCRPGFAVINNKAEGSAPLSAFRLAARLV
jgi:hypothetical protein